MGSGQNLVGNVVGKIFRRTRRELRGMIPPGGTEPVRGKRDERGTMQTDIYCITNTIKDVQGRWELVPELELELERERLSVL